MRGEWRRVTWMRSSVELFGVTVLVLMAFAIRRNRRMRPSRAPSSSLQRHLALCTLSLLIIIAAAEADGALTFSRWSTASAAGRAAATQPQAALVARTPGDHSLVGAPSITAQQIDTTLAFYGSPAAGQGQAFYDLGIRYGIDPAYALAFFIHESSAATNPEWAGLKEGGATTHNIGNIICAGYATCYGRFRDYPSWHAGIEDWYRLITTEYVGERGLTTIEQIVPVYAPSVENDVAGYIASVEALVESWRRTR